MKTSTKNTWIGSIVALFTAIIGTLAGSTYEKNKQNDYVQSQIVDVSGDHNTVSINSVDELLTAYNKLSSDYETLTEQNNENFNNYKDLKTENETLASQLGDTPVLQFKDLGLIIDSRDIPVNSNQALLIADGREYISMDFFSSMLGEDETLTIKNNNAYIGKVIEDKTSLLSLNIMDKYHCNIDTPKTDSYGNLYANCISMDGYSGNIIFTTNRKYSYLSATLAPSENDNIDCIATISILADDVPIYSTQLTKITEPITLTDLNINNCNLLKIEFNSSGGGINSIFADASVYN